MLRVIMGIRKPKIDYCSIYTRVTNELILKGNEEVMVNGKAHRDTLKKIVFHGARMINYWMDNVEGNLNDISQKELNEGLALIFLIKSYIAALTPNEFIQIFPIDKEYQGERWGTKDYFYTIQELNKVNCDDPIGYDNVNMFLFDYWNYKDIGRFEVNSMKLIGAKCRREGKQTPVEKFVENMGVATYTEYEDHKGTKYFVNSDTGDTIEAGKPKKRRPKHMKIITGGAI